MQPSETRALWRAVALLVLISAGRWAWTATDDAPGGETVLPELLAESREAAAEGARRAEPLVEGERLDPNRAAETELDRLPGVGPATARAIVAARESGAVFRRVEDLLTVRGIGEATLERIRPALDLSSPPLAARVGAAASGRLRGTTGRAPSQPTGRVDVSRAGVEELQLLPGIGPALAERIVAARQEQMFTSLDDLARVRGIGEATVERLRPYASVGGVP